MRSLDSIFRSALPFGIDVGASGIRLMQLCRSGRGLRVHAGARIEMPCVTRPDAPERPAVIADNVSKRLALGGFRGRECVLSVDNRLVRVRSVRQPPMPDDELDSAVRLDAPGRLGFGDADPAQVAWIRAGSVRNSGDPRDEILVIGSAKEWIERLVFALASHGLRPIAVEPSFIASVRAHTRRLRRASDENVVRAVVDIGHMSTGVMVTRGQGLVFYKQLELGGQAMTKAAATRLGIDPEVVAELRRQRSAASASGASVGDPKVDRALFEAVRPVIGDLANEAALCLRYYGVTFRGSRPECCVIAGGEACEPRLVELFAEALHVPTIVSRPFEGIDCSRASGLGAGWDSCGAAWSVAAGLSMRAWLGKPERAEPVAESRVEAAQPMSERRAA